jgi:hypothetical protein
MKTQKYFYITAALLMNFSIGCSTHPEIKPYEAPQGKELAVDDTPEESMDLPDVADGFVEDAELTDEEPQALAKTEEKLPEPENIVEEKKVEPKIKSQAKVAKVEKSVKKSAERAPASTLKNGYYVFDSNCEMKSSPKSKSETVGSISKGKKLWLDVHNGTWLKAYKKNGTAYVPASCVK